MRVFLNKKPNPAIDHQTIEMSIEMMHRLLERAYAGFYAGNGSVHVSKCLCERCKYVKRNRWMRTTKKHYSNMPKYLKAKESIEDAY